MTTVRYARYVLVNEDKGSVVWFESKDSAENAHAVMGGTVYDYDNADRQTVEHAIHSARHRMGIE